MSILKYSIVVMYFTVDIKHVTDRWYDYMQLAFANTQSLTLEY